MAISNLNLEKVTSADLSQLIDGQVAEGLLYEYKRDRYGGADDDKREAIKDVSSFANSSGGHLIIGMAEDKGLPIELIGLEGDMDIEIQRLENLFRNCIEPRIVGLRLRAVPVNDARSAIVIQVPKSWNPPHRVSYKNSHRFYIRNSAGTHEASVDELRVLFTAGATIHDRVRAFRHERITRISAGEGPIDLPSHGWVILHLVPFSALGGGNQVDLRRLYGTANIPPIGRTGFDPGYNFDGYFVAGAGQPAYTQVFRNGIIESAAGDLAVQGRDGQPVLNIHFVERNILEAVNHYMIALSQMEVPPPVAVMLSLEGMHGVRLEVHAGWPPDGKPIRGNELLFPEVVLQEYQSEADYKQALKPTFDALWNIGGMRGSPNYE